MADCPECEARRRKMMDDFLNAKIASAMGHAVAGVAEMVGLKNKTALVEENEKPAARRKKADG